ncbi:putative IQ motif and SEC7 domain-containing protein 1 [Apostichopus japonicus]|uniref:Putative IQ motif and SEC7 domain-containing protein 1 n=1 Tax=Stichopus japonicus TaxID=307972 RepID=A0A2G8L2L2_STIJA|nr:putative IQ motif and SEC7 domain-containing protein 1 [Apostichopus japonicus]
MDWIRSHLQSILPDREHGNPDYGHSIQGREDKEDSSDTVVVEAVEDGDFMEIEAGGTEGPSKERKPEQYQTNRGRTEGEDISAVDSIKTGLKGHDDDTGRTESEIRTPSDTDDAGQSQLSEKMEMDYQMVTEEDLLLGVRGGEGRIEQVLPQDMVELERTRHNESQMEESSKLSGFLTFVETLAADVPVARGQEVLQCVNSRVLPRDISDDDLGSRGSNREDGASPGVGIAQLNKTPDALQAIDETSKLSFRRPSYEPAPLIRVKSSADAHSDSSDDVFFQTYRRSGRNFSLPTLSGTAPHLQPTELMMLENVIWEIRSELEDEILLEKPLVDRRKSSLPGTLVDVGALKPTSNQVIIQWYQSQFTLCYFFTSIYDKRLYRGRGVCVGLAGRKGREEREEVQVSLETVTSDRNKNTSKPGGTNDTIYEDRESPHTQSPLRPDGDNRRSGAYTPPNRNRRPDSKISPQGKPPLRREKSITQRREEERQIQKSRAFSNSYELSADLYNKQVEMLERRYGGRQRAQSAARVIQEAYRKYEMNREFQKLRRTRSESRISKYLDHHLRNTKEWGVHSNRAKVMVIEEPPGGEVEARGGGIDQQRLRKSETIDLSEVNGKRSNGPLQHRNNCNNVGPKGIPDSRTTKTLTQTQTSKKVVVKVTLQRNEDGVEVPRFTDSMESSIERRRDFMPPTVDRAGPHKAARSVERKVIITTQNESFIARNTSPVPSRSPSGNFARQGHPAKASMIPIPSDHRGAVPSPPTRVTGPPNIKSKQPPPPPQRQYGSPNTSPRPSVDYNRSGIDTSATTQVKVQDVSGSTGRKAVVDTSDSLQSKEEDRKEGVSSVQSMGDQYYRDSQSSQQQIDRQDNRAVHYDNTDGQENGKVVIVTPVVTAANIPVQASRKKNHSEGDLLGSSAKEMTFDDRPQYPATNTGISGMEQNGPTHRNNFDFLEIHSPVPSVQIHKPHGAHQKTDHYSSSDSEDSEDEDTRRPRSATSDMGQAEHSQLPKARSMGNMNSPVWKRKAMDPNNKSKSMSLTNGSETLPRSETRESVSSESSGSSKFTGGDDSSSISESVDSLTGELNYNQELFEKRTSAPSLSIPMTATRKRRYRLGVNLFNKKPEKGIKFLVENKFLDNSPNEVAKFLLTHSGFCKQKIGEYLGNLQKDFNMMVLECYVAEMNFKGLPIDEALRKFQSTFRMPGEAQKIERLMEAFSQRYCVCNTDSIRNFRSADTFFILAFAIIMLNTDLHSPNVKSERRMKLDDFIKNLSGIDDNCDVDREYLEGIYMRIKQKPYQPAEDHTNTVIRLERSVIGERPMLAEPHRRLVSSCSLLEINDPTKKDKKHIREVFLLNDMLLITKQYRKKQTVQFGYKKHFSLQGTNALEFSTAYYPFGIRLVSTINEKVLATFCAGHPDDRHKFVSDLRETIQECAEMEEIRIGTELERQKNIRKSQNSNTDSGVGLDTASLASNPNLSGSMDSLAPGLSEAALKRTSLSNSLIDIKEASALSVHRSSATSLDSGVSVSKPSSVIL